MSSDDATRVLLGDGVGVDDVHRLAYGLDLLVSQLGDRRGGQPAEDIWRSMDESTWLQLVDDPHIGMRYLTVRGKDAKKVVDAAKQGLDTVPVIEPLQQLKSAGDTGQKVDALYKLAVAGGSEAVEAVKTALSDEDPTVRHAAIVATGYLGGRALTAGLKRVAEEDSDEKVKSDAALMLDVLEKET